MIVLTGDVHHMTLGTRDQQRLPPGQTEVTACERFLEIVTSFGIIPTIYVSGKAAKEEYQQLAALWRRFKPEIGGHTYYCYRPLLPYRISRRALRLANGPRCLQRFEVARTIKALSRVCTSAIVSWRNHGYRQDRNTPAILVRYGILGISNEVGPGLLPGIITSKFGRIATIPINTPPDHENVHPDPGFAGTWRFRSIHEWCDETLRHVARNEQTGVPSVIIAHPACMAIEDGMSSLERLAATLANYQCVTMRDLARTVLNL